MDIHKEPPMKFETNRALLAAVASALALGLAACGERPDNDKVGQNLEPGKERVNQPAGNVEQRLDRAGSDIRDKATEAGKAIDDATLTAKVKSALVSEPNLRAATINVDIMAGVVTLKGTTDTQESRQKAAQVASTVDGVRDVRNELVVISG
jgi:hyperosmotically inducible periplasmic protein